MPSRKPYPSDVSDKRALVAPYLTLLPEAAGQREHTLREEFNELRYPVRYGVACRAMHSSAALCARKPTFRFRPNHAIGVSAGESHLRPPARLERTSSCHAFYSRFPRFSDLGVGRVPSVWRAPLDSSRKGSVTI
jgi:hypothetical protein